MPHHYSDRTRELEPTALPDIEVFWDDISEAGPGWYWWSCFTGCLPDGDAYGPFETEGDALADARDSAER